MGKTLQELTIIDNWLFGAVMLDPEICRGLLERALDRKIERVEVLREKSLDKSQQRDGRVVYDLSGNTERRKGRGP